MLSGVEPRYRHFSQSTARQQCPTLNLHGGTERCAQEMLGEFRPPWWKNESYNMDMAMAYAEMNADSV